MAEGEELVQRRLADLEQLVDGGWFEYDVATRTASWSPGLRRLYGIEDAGFRGGLDEWLELVHPDDRAQSRQAMVDAAVDQSTFDLEHRFHRRSDGVERWAHVRGTADGEEGRTERIFGVSVDITERRRADLVLSSFIANAAHELRTPAAAIGQSVHALRGGVAEADREVVLEILARQATRLRNLTNNLVDLGRLDAGGDAATREPVDVRVALDEAIGVAPVPLDRTLREDVPAGIEVLADRTQFERVLVNLLVNAWRYGGPTVRVSARRLGDRVELRVADDGEGVPAEIAAHLFEPFRRGPQRHPEASGLGLAIVEGLVRGMGGSIAYRPGEPGATFVITLDAPPPGP